MSTLCLFIAAFSDDEAKNSEFWKKTFQGYRLQKFSLFYLDAHSEFDNKEVISAKDLQLFCIEELIERVVEGWFSCEL